MTDLTKETTADLRQQRSSIEAELERRDREETRPVYEVRSVYGQKTFKTIEDAKKYLIEELTDVDEADFSQSQKRILVGITQTQLTLTEYAIMPDSYYG